MKWYKILKLIIELLTFGLCTYEKFEKQEKEDSDDSGDSAANSSSDR